MLNHPINAAQTVGERIRQLRAQMLVHSCIYYHLDSNVIGDHTWQARANELRDLQNMFGGAVGYHDEAFEGWDGSSGAFLPIRHPDVVGRAEWLLRRA